MDFTFIHHRQNPHMHGGFGGVPMGMAMGPMGPFPFPLHMGHPGAPPPATTPSSSAADKSKKEKDKKTRSKDKEGDEEEDADWEEEEVNLDAEDDDTDKASASSKDKDPDDEKKKKGEKDRGGMPGMGFFKRMTQGSGSKDITPKANKGTGRVGSRTDGSGKKKGSGSRRVMSKAASKGGDRDLDLEDDDSNSNTSGRSDPYNDERRPGETSPGGKTLLGLFEVLGVEAPKDQGLRGLWERMADEEVCDRIARANRRALARELRRLGLWSSTSSLSTATATSSTKQLQPTQDASSDSEAAVKKPPPSDAKGKNKSGLGRVLRGLDDLLQRQVGGMRCAMQHRANID